MYISLKVYSENIWYVSFTGRNVLAKSVSEQCQYLHGYDITGKVNSQTEILGKNKVKMS